MPDPTVPPAVPPGDPDDTLFVEPPRWPKVIGIISIVWAALGLTCTGLGVLFFLVLVPMMQAGAQQQSPGASMPPTMQMDPLKWANFAAAPAIILLLMVAGIMLVNRRPAARAVFLAYAAIAILAALGGTYVQWLSVQQMPAWRQANPTSPFAQKGSATGDLIGLAFGAVIGLAWPIFCLIWFGLVKRTPDSMTGGIEDPAA